MIVTLQQVVAISDRDHWRHLVTDRCTYAATGRRYSVTNMYVNATD